MKLKKGDYPLVSINIRTYNSEKTLVETLESVKGQTYENIEIVVSDGFSKDKSVEIAEKFGAKIHYVDKLGDARYKDVYKSKGEYILSLDSDQVMDMNLVSECVKKCQKDGYDALIISEKSFTIYNTFLEKLISYDKYLIDKDRGGNSIFDNACPRFFKRKVLASIFWPKGLSIFDDSILYALLIKTKTKIGYLKNVSIWHHELGSWRVLIRKFYRYGKGYLQAFKVSPKVVGVHSLPRRSYFSKYVFEKPKFILPLFLLYLVKVAAALFGAAVSIFGEKNR